MNDTAPLTPDDGVYHDFDATEYHAIERMSASGAKKILRSPQHYRLERDQPSEPSPAMEFGTACHLGVLEPERFATGVICAPKFDMRRTGAKEAKELFDKANAGNIQLNHGDFDRARRCIDAVREHPAATYLLDGAKAEVSLLWHDKLYEVPCKARLDIMNHGGVIDLKTCGDASPEGFSRAIGQFDYSIQAWSNFSGSEHVLNATPTFFAFIAVETEPPYAVAVYQLGRESIMMGARLWDEALARYKRALELGKWEGYSDKIETINAPRWKLRHEA